MPASSPKAQCDSNGGSLQASGVNQTAGVFSGDTTCATTAGVTQDNNKQSDAHNTHPAAPQPAISQASVNEPSLLSPFATTLFTTANDQTWPPKLPSDVIPSSMHSFPSSYDGKPSDTKCCLLPPTAFLTKRDGTPLDDILSNQTPRDIGDTWASKMQPEDEDKLTNQQTKGNRYTESNGDAAVLDSLRSRKDFINPAEELMFIKRQLNDYQKTKLKLKYVFFNYILKI